MSLFTELKRRNVFRVAAAYIVTAWLIVQVAETLFPAYGLSDAALRVVVNVLAIGLVPVLVLSWVFEWTPEGLRRDSQLQPDRPAAAKVAKRLDRAILVVLAIALSYFAFDKFVLDPARDVEIAEAARQEGRAESIIDAYGDQSIAVLAFEDMSPEKDQEYLSDGLAEEILNLLAKIPDLRVISRTSAFAYKGKDIPIPTIAAQLNVAHILEGSVRKAGNRIRVTAQLIEARSDTHIWSETYDRDLDDIFAIQDELAASMVDQLHVTLLGEAPKSRQVDPEAYMLWLEGRHFAGYVDADRAIELLERAVEIDPGFADAWQDLAWVYYQKSETLGQREHEGDEYYAMALAAEKRIEEIDPDHPWILMGRAFVPVEESTDWPEAARRLQHALEIHPRDVELQRISMIFARSTFLDDISLAIGANLLAQDPLCTQCSYHLARSLLVAGKYSEAEAEILRFKSLVPTSAGWTTLGNARLLAGDIEGARQAFAQWAHVELNSEQGRANTRFGELLVQLFTGEVADPKRAVSDFLADETMAQYAGFGAAELHALAGDADAAFAIIEQRVENQFPWRAASPARNPFLVGLHDDPRWMDYLEAVGLAPHQREKIVFDPPLRRVRH